MGTRVVTRIVRAGSSVEAEATRSSFVDPRRRRWHPRRAALHASSGLTNETVDLDETEILEPQRARC
jgi:hypothetical protein